MKLKHRLWNIIKAELLVLCCFSRPWLRGCSYVVSLLPDLFDNESQTSCLFDKITFILICPEIIVHINMYLNLVSLRSVLSRNGWIEAVAEATNDVIWDIVYGVALCPHINFSGGLKILLFVFSVHIILHTVRITFMHKGFVLSPTFLRPDVLCHICWDKSGLETSAWMWWVFFCSLSFDHQGAIKPHCWLALLYSVVMAAFMYYFLKQRVLFLYEMWSQNPFGVLTGKHLFLKV